MDKNIEVIEKTIKQIETEKDFNKVIDLFSSAVKVIKESMAQTKEARGRVLEIVRELDEYIEKEMKVGNADEC